MPKKILFLPLFFFLLANTQLIWAQSNPSTTESQGMEAIPIDMKALEKKAIVWGFGGRIGPSSSRMNTSSGQVMRVSEFGLPVVQNGQIIRDQLVSNTGASTGFQAAMLVVMNMGNFFLQPELQYGKKGGKYDFLDKNGELIQRANAKFTMIDLPLLFGVHFSKARLFAGPSVSYILGKNAGFDESMTNYLVAPPGKEIFKRPTINTLVGAGYQIGSFFIDLRFENGIMNYAKMDIGPMNTPKSFAFTVDQFVLSVGFLK